MKITWEKYMELHKEATERIPADLKDASERWKLSSLISEVWAQAYISGWLARNEDDE